MSWLEDNRFKSWLNPGKLSSQAICTLCNNAWISAEKMGVIALSSHAQGKNTKKKKRSNPMGFHVFFFQPSSSKLKQKESNSSTSRPSTTIDSFIIPLSKLKSDGF